MYPLRLFAAAGGLVSYGQDDSETSPVIATLVGRVLNGEKPENLPVQQVTKFELVINSRTAKSLGVQIPMHLLGLAEMIE